MSISLEEYRRYGKIGQQVITKVPNENFYWMLELVRDKIDGIKEWKYIFLFEDKMTAKNYAKQFSIPFIDERYIM